MINYFAYGSNMLESQMQDRCLSADSFADGILRGYRVVFNKYSSVDKSGKANIEPSEHGNVWGVLYRMSEDDFEGLKVYEKGYDAVEMEIECGKENVRAFVFIAQAKSVRKGLRPTKAYLETIVKGAAERLIPNTYTDELEKTARVRLEHP